MWKDIPPHMVLGTTEDLKKIESSLQFDPGKDGSLLTVTTRRSWCSLCWSAFRFPFVFWEAAGLTAYARTPPPG
jgi:hypothetical protein